MYTWHVYMNRSTHVCTNTYTQYVDFLPSATFPSPHGTAGNSSTRIRRPFHAPPEAGQSDCRQSQFAKSYHRFSCCGFDPRCHRVSAQEHERKRELAREYTFFLSILTASNTCWPLSPQCLLMIYTAMIMAQRLSECEHDDDDHMWSSDRQNWCLRCEWFANGSPIMLWLWKFCAGFEKRDDEKMPTYATTVDYLYRLSGTYM